MESIARKVQRGPRPLSVAGGLRTWIARVVERADPLRVIVLGYLFYIAVGFAALSLPWAQSAEVGWFDRLFMAVSAVTTSGLTTHDPGASYTFLGELALLLMMQAGALGYLTLGTFVAVMLSDSMSRRRAEIARTALGLPETIDVKLLIKRVVAFTLIIQVAGAALLYPQFLDAGVADPSWAAIFHAVSAFCTAGLSIFADSFESFQDRPGILMTMAALSSAGALGFLVLSESLDFVRERKRGLGFTSRVALLVTLAYTIICTLALLMCEPRIGALPPSERIWTALFTVVSAGTTAGFHTIPVAILAPAIIVMLFLVMMFGAAPGGTAGGLKSSTLAILIALVVSTLRRRTRVTLLGLEILPDKIQQATASVAFYCILAGGALFTLLLSESAPFEHVMFETISALSGAGMSMGLTPHLSTTGQAVVMGLMLIGRVGILAFGLAIATRDARDHDPDDADIVL